MQKTNTGASKKEARWPFVTLNLFMWAGMIGTTLNRDPIKFEFSVAVVFGLVAIAGIVAFLFYGRIRGLSFITLDVYSTLTGNLALHVLILTGVRGFVLRVVRCRIQCLGATSSSQGAFLGLRMTFC